MPRPHEATTPKTLPSKQRLKSVRQLIYKRGYGKLNKQTIPLANNKVIEQGLGAGEDEIVILACLLLLGDSLLLLLEVNSRRLLEVRLLQVGFLWPGASRRMWSRPNWR